MARETYVMRDGKLVPKREARPLHRPAPHVISDTVDPFRSMVDGRIYDSKSRYTRSVKAKGYEIVGNDYGHLTQEAPITGPADRDIERSIKSTMERMGWQ